MFEAESWVLQQIIFCINRCDLNWMWWVHIFTVEHTDYTESQNRFSFCVFQCEVNWWWNRAIHSRNSCSWTRWEVGVKRLHCWFLPRITRAEPGVHFHTYNSRYFTGSLTVTLLRVTVNAKFLYFKLKTVEKKKLLNTASAIRDFKYSN